MGNAGRRHAVAFLDHLGLKQLTVLSERDGLGASPNELDIKFIEDACLIERHG